MKKIPMILLLIMPYVILVCNFTSLDIYALVPVYGGILIGNVIYALLMPRLRFDGRQILFWNLLIKVCSIPIVLFIGLFALVMLMIGGVAHSGEFSVVLKYAFGACYVLQLCAAVFGFSGFLQFYRYGRISAKSMVICVAAQLIPLISIISSFVGYFSLRDKVPPCDSWNFRA